MTKPRDPKRKNDGEANCHFVIYRNDSGQSKIRIFRPDEEQIAIAVYRASGGGAFLVSAESFLALAQSEAHGPLLASLTSTRKGAGDER